MGKGFSVFLGETGKRFLETIVSTKASPEVFDVKYRSEFKHGFQEKRPHKSRDMQFFLQNVQNDIFKIFKMFKNNMKFNSTAC